MPSYIGSLSRRRLPNTLLVSSRQQWQHCGQHQHNGLMGNRMASSLRSNTCQQEYYGCSPLQLKRPITTHKPFPISPVAKFFGTIRIFSSTTTTTTTPTPTAGEEAYQQAMQLLQRVQEIEREREEERSQRMYDAWQKSQQKEQDRKTQGVKVIKTLVKETQKDHKNKGKNGVQDEGGNNNNHHRQAMELLRHAARIHQHPEAAVQLGNMLLNEATVILSNKKKKNMDDTTEFDDDEYAIIEKQLVEEAIDMFKLAGEGGSRVGWYNLGQLLWTGFPPAEEDDDADISIDENDGDDDDSQHNKIVPADMYEAMEAFIRAIDLGDGDAMYLVGVHRITQGGKENFHSGSKLIERAANAGHGGALYYLALLHLNGEPHLGLEPCTLDEFMMRLDRAIEAGNTDARFTRGHSYYHGSEGYPQDFKRALDDFLQAADEGHADSAVSAGAMLHHGVGVLADQRRAFELYQLAGELGSEEGWVNVIDCWRQGLGVPKSEDTARHIEETMLKKRWK